jgi:hypothetical protein
MGTSLVDALAVGALVVAIILLQYALQKKPDRGEKFSARAAEVARGATEVFAPSCGAAAYSDYKSRVADADPVQYADVRGLWRARYGGDCGKSAGGSLHPDEVEKFI